MRLNTNIYQKSHVLATSSHNLPVSGEFDEFGGQFGVLVTWCCLWGWNWCKIICLSNTSKKPSHNFQKDSINYNDRIVVLAFPLWQGLVRPCKKIEGPPWIYIRYQIKTSPSSQSQLPCSRVWTNKTLHVGGRKNWAMWVTVGKDEGEEH